MEAAAEAYKLATTVKAPNYHSLTGLEMLAEFDECNKGGFCCSKLWNETNSISLGIVGMIVSDMLALESLCDDLVAWDKTVIDRKSWRSNLVSAVNSWEGSTVWRLGPKSKSDGDSAIIDSPDHQLHHPSVGVSKGGSTTHATMAHTLSTLKVSRR